MFLLDRNILICHILCVKMDFKKYKLLKWGGEKNWLVIHAFIVKSRRIERFNQISEVLFHDFMVI